MFLFTSNLFFSLFLRILYLCTMKFYRKVSGICGFGDPGWDKSPNQLSRIPQDICNYLMLTSPHIGCHHYETFNDEGHEDQRDAETWQSHSASEWEETHLQLRQASRTVFKGPAEAPSFTSATSSRKPSWMCLSSPTDPHILPLT